ncbi:6713_t:CDS:2 [Funneliformis mosseae]|uniref:6713_t:CDS:1 n=1 Tax=Funneliformis mosseae TaxID=27381 RepID=A0A9N9B6C2_FUNMO|nr:6713_t:CDS:2 [Funneliformis mosseae]
MPNESKKRAQTSNINESNSEKFTEEKIEQIDSIQELDNQLATYVAEMKQKNGQQYSASSVRCAIAAIHRHLIKHSVISEINIHDQATFSILWEVLNGKLKFLSDLGFSDAKGADVLSIDEILTIFNHKILDSTTPERLLYQIYFYNALLLGIRGKKHFALLLEDFKKREDGGFTVYIYHSKTNQRGAFRNRGKADKILIPYNEEFIQYYNKYILLHPKNADPEFYLQEMEDKDDK